MGRKNLLHLFGKGSELWKFKAEKIPENGSSVFNTSKR
jgi:hypothetical protein